MITSRGHSLLSDDIVDKLKESILVKKEFSPNDRLPNERLLAEHFGVSRSSVREAIKSLTASGILVVKHGSGTYVAQRPGELPDPLGLEGVSDLDTMLREWYQVRLALEPEALRMAVENASDQEINGIIALAQEENDLILQDHGSFLEVDREFHLAIAKATHNTVMERLIASLQQSFYYTSEKLHLEEWHEQSKANAMKYHPIIAEFLRLRDAEGTMLAMRMHLLQGLHAID